VRIGFFRFVTNYTFVTDGQTAAFLWLYRALQSFCKNKMMQFFTHVVDYEQPYWRVMM